MQTQPIPCHLAPLTAIIANRPEAQQLPEVAGERQVEAEPSDKLAESLQLIRWCCLLYTLRSGKSSKAPAAAWRLTGRRARQGVAI